jgi:hypothetical protein
VGEGSPDRLVAWNRELLAAHRRLRAAWEVARTALETGAEPEAARRDLLLYCTGFCTALDGHHDGESAALFPALLDRFPELAPTIAKLQQDHDMIAGLLLGLDRAIRAQAPSASLVMHLDGLGAAMESHFGFEERRLLEVLARLELDADVRTVLGPL